MINYKLPSQLENDIDGLAALIAKYREGQISAVELKAHRVPFGVYEQRERDTYMVRIRCAAGCVTPSQLKEIALLSSEYGDGLVHITTRQELQVHYVSLEDIIPIIRRLKETGLSSRGGGGNTVRNITAQEDAGIALDEVFDVTPYAIALTDRLISEDDSWSLPRKLKIAFSGSSRDKGYATISDIGFIAVLKEGKKGFRVYAAGGMGAKSQTGKLLFDFIPAQEAYYAAKAVKTVFWKYGNRKNKHAARLRFLWQGLGGEEFKRRVMEEYEALKMQKSPLLEISEIVNSAVLPALFNEKIDDTAGFELWKKRFARPQRQDNLFSIIVPVELGFIDGKQVSKLSDFLGPFGDNIIRMTKDQNFLIRNIHAQYLANLYNHLKNTPDHFNRPLILDKILSCAGASTCQLGICLSRPAARAIMKALSQDKELDLDRLSGLKINISGCPNSCGQHLAADLGFFGKAGRKDTRIYPAYNIVAGAGIKDGEMRFAQGAGEVASRDLPNLVRDFLRLYLSKISRYEDFGHYYESEGRQDLEQVRLKYETVPAFEEDKNYYFDWESDKPFSLAERGGGECSAGLFDLIESDLKKIEGIQAQIKNKPVDLREFIFYVSRMLLITRAIEPKTEEEVFENFEKLFIETGLADASFKNILEAAKNKDTTFLLKEQAEVLRLAERVKFLYANMDNSFHFTLPDLESLSQGVSQINQKTGAGPDARPRIIKDLRGVACPMNFVKTKMELSLLKPKDILEVWLDDGEPIENVPGSVRAEGHIILEQKRVDNYWSVVIEKR